jgi:hypothetical protein
MVVLLVPDNDPPGRKWADDIGCGLQGVAREIRILELPTVWSKCPHKGDVSDWIAAGMTVDQFWEAAEKAPLWLPPPPPANDNAPAFSQEDIALQFATKYTEELRFVANWGRWMQWTETKWVTDNTLGTFDKARALCRLAANTYFATSDDQKKRA